MLSVVLPTYNEAENIASLIDVLDVVLQSTPHEIIVVDDNSPDGTARRAESLMPAHPSLRVIRRKGTPGLSAAVTEGFDAAVGEVLAVMDADGQHDAELLVSMLAAMKKGNDLVIGSRYVKGGHVGEWVRDRRIISRLGTLLAMLCSRVKVSDPLGGFFLLRRGLYRDVRERLRPTGFKILLEILAALPSSTRVSEVPLIFRMRLHGKSKLSLRVHLQFLVQIIRLSFARLFGDACLLCLPVFSIVSVVIGLFFLPKLLALSPLLDSGVQSSALKAVRAVADHEGWLLSDLSIVSVDSGSVTVSHRPHRRGHVEESMCVIDFAAPTPVCRP